MAVFTLGTRKRVNITIDMEGTSESVSFLEITNKQLQNYYDSLESNSNAKIVKAQVDILKECIENPKDKILEAIDNSPIEVVSELFVLIQQELQKQKEKK